MGSRAERALYKWIDTEFYLGTDQGPRHWDDFWSEVRVGRRAYAVACILFGTVAAAAAGAAAYIIAGRPGTFLLVIILADLVGLALAWIWGRVLAMTIAPLLLRNGQRMARMAYLALLLPVIPLSLLMSDLRTGWTVVAAVLVILPWWTSAYLESRRPIPPYPDEWKGFTTG